MYMYMYGETYTCNGWAKIYMYCTCIGNIINIHVHVWAEIYMYVYGQKYTCTCVGRNVHVCVWTKIYMYMCVGRNVHVYMCWQTYMYRYMICVGKTMHTKIYMYTCMCWHCFSDVINDWQCKVHVW